MLDCAKNGIRCLKPTDDASRYDLLLDIDGIFKRVQCKTSRWSTDTVNPNVAFEIATCRITTNTKESKRYKYTKQDIDYFYTNFNNKGYLIPVEKACGISFRLRYTYPCTG